MRLAPQLVAALAASAVLALPATAKEGVRAKLDAPVRLDAASGKTIRVAWRLVDAGGHRFGASGIYLRVSRCGRAPIDIPAAAASGRGAYSARVRVPQGGIRKLVVGLQGWRTIGARRERADAFFAFDPPLVRRCA